MINNSEKQRLKSLDAFRGLTIACMIIVNTPGDWAHVFAPLRHSEWNGCTPTDLVFPSFIFMVGISIVFAFASKKPDPALHKGIILKALRRMLIIIGIGLGLQLISHHNFATIRYPGVLQRIGVVYFISTLLYIKLPERALKYILAVIVIGYYLLICVLPPPLLNSVTPTQNLSAWFDHWLIGEAHLAKFAYTDPCGVLGTISAIGTGLLGILTGLILKDKDMKPENKALNLLVGGNLLIICGLVTNLIFPFNKPIWSSSYVLYAGGISMAGFAILYWLTDLNARFRKYNFLDVLGINAISAYVLSEALPALLNLIKIKIGSHHFRGMKIVNELFNKLFIAEWASLFTAIIFLVIIWGIMYAFYRKRWIIKI